MAFLKSWESGRMSSLVESHPQLHLQQRATSMEFELAHFSHLHGKMCLFSLSSHKSFFTANPSELPASMLCFCTNPAAAQSSQIIVFFSVPGMENWKGNVLLDISAWLGALRLLPEASPSPGASWPGAAGASCVQGCVLQVGEHLSHTCSSENSPAAHPAVLYCVVWCLWSLS